MKYKSLLYLASLLSVLTLALSGFLGTPAAAQQVSGSAIIAPNSQMEIPPPRVRTWAEMEAAAAQEAAGPPPPVRLKKFRPTMGEAAYQALKAQAAQTRALQAPLAPSVESPAPLAATTLTSPVNFPGVTQDIFFPPDTEGAVGLNHFVEVTNTHIDIYQKIAPNSRVNGNGNGVTLNSFFGYTGPSSTSLFDPRVVYDPGFNRWIVTADAFAESATVQYFFIAVSQTSDPLGAFYIYQVNVSDGNGLAGDAGWDFPQVGFDQNALIFTANFFNRFSVFTGAQMFAVAKSLLYNGPSQTLNPSLFTGLVGTLTPPIVLDNNANTYLVADNTPSSQVTLYTLTNSATTPSLSSSTIPVPAFSAPPNVPQPGTSAVIDPSDGRFVNVSTQIGNSLFQVHTINIGGFARPRFYEFDTVNKTVIQSGTFAKSSTSYDFNASIAANRLKDVFVTWSATDTSDQAQVRFSGRLHTDTAGVIPSGSVLFPSTVALTGNTQAGVQRWGDYSAVSIDPGDPTGLTAWIVNETVADANHWGSRIGSIKLPNRRSPTGAYQLLLLD